MRVFFPLLLMGLDQLEGEEKMTLTLPSPASGRGDKKRPGGFPPGPPSG
jgi:hypothetical protein